MNCRLCGHVVWCEFRHHGTGLKKVDTWTRALSTIEEQYPIPVDKFLSLICELEIINKNKMNSENL